MSVKLYVGNLPHAMTEAELNTLFSEAGNVASAKIITDRQTGQPRGFGFVEMETKVEAQKAISMLNGRTVEGRPLTVNEARPQQKSSFGGGGGGGAAVGRRPGRLRRGRRLPLKAAMVGGAQCARPSLINKNNVGATPLVGRPFLVGEHVLARPQSLACALQGMSPPAPTSR